MAERAIVQAVKFSVVGAVGFLVDAGLLFALVASGTNPLVARLFSFACAVTVTWLLNASWTFAKSRSARAEHLYARYVAVQIGGALVNYAIYAILIVTMGSSPFKALGALCVGAIAGLVVNFSGAKFMVFNSHESAGD